MKSEQKKIHFRQEKSTYSVELHDSKAYISSYKLMRKRIERNHHCLLDEYQRWV